MAAASNPRSTVDLEEAQSTASAADLAILEPSRAWQTPALVGGIGAGVVGLGLLLFLGSGSGAAWETVPLTAGTLKQRVTAVGTLQPVAQVQIGSDLTGEVVEVRVDVNDAVKTDDVLARLDPEPFENTVAQARAQASTSRANLDKARVDLERAETRLARTERLVGKGAATEVERDDARLDVAAAQALVAASAASRDQARASLRRAEQDLRDAVVVTPIDGIVVRRLVDPGQTVVSAMAATPLFEVATDLNALEAIVEVDEADVGLVAAGQPATFTVTAWPDRRFAAVVASVDLAAAPGASVVVYETELRVNNTEGHLRPGMTATAEIEVGEVADAWLVPTRALRFRPEAMPPPDGDHLWALRDDELVAVPVRVGGSDGALTAVYGDDLNEGLPIVVGGGA